jgi:hypothetical protein
MIREVPESVRQQIAQILGQPEGAAQVTVTVDGLTVDVPAGTTILKAMRKVGRTCPRSATPTACSRSAPAGPAWSSRRAARS